MIHCYFNETSYYIAGEKIEIFSSIFNDEKDSIRRSYWALIMLLPELQAERDNVMIYSDSRVIDELSGEVIPLDIWTQQARHIIMQMTCCFNGICIYKKIDTLKLNRYIENGRARMIDDNSKKMMQETLERQWNFKHSNRVRKLRTNFLGEGNGN